MAGISVGFLNFKVAVQSTNFTKSLNKMQRKAAKFGKAMQRTGASMTRSLTLPLVALGAGATKVFMDFEQGMLKVKAVSGATDGQMKMLEETAKKLGATTMFSASQVAELQLNLSKLGLTPEEINKATESILVLSQATGEDLGETATVVASTMRAFGLTADDTQRITNVMADSFSSSALDLEKFKTAMSTLAPVAKESGIEIEEASALVGVLANNGVDASTAGTALRNIFLDLSKEGMTMEEAMNKINNSTDPLTTAFDLFGKRGATVATILSKNQEEIQKLTQDFIDSDNEAQGMADTMDSGLAGSLRRLKSQTEAAGIELGEVLAPAVDALAGFIGNLMDKFSGLSDEFKLVIVIVGGVIAILGPLFLIIGKVAMAYVAVTKAILLAKAAQGKLNLTMLMNPIFLVITLVVALIAGFIHLFNSVEEVRGVIHGLFKAAKQVFVGLKDLVLDTLGGVGDILIGIFTLDTDRIIAGFNASKKAVQTYGAEIADEFRSGYEEGLQSEPIDVGNLLGITADDVDVNAQDVNVDGENTDVNTDEITNLISDDNSSSSSSSSSSNQPQSDPFQIDIDALKRNHKEAILAEKENLLNGVITKEEFNKRIREEELGHLEQMKVINLAYGKDVLDLEEKIVDAKQNIFDNTEVREFEGALGSLGDKMSDFFNVDLKTLEDGMMDILTKLGDELAQGADSFEEYAKNVKGMLKDVIGGLISQGVTAAVTNALTSTSFLPPFLIPVVAGAAAGLARTAFNSLIPAFAEGGLVTGPTLGLIGEGIGTNASNPEVIAPLDKLKGFMNGGNKVVVEGVIKGNDIFLSNQRTKQNRFRTT